MTSLSIVAGVRNTSERIRSPWHAASLPRERFGQMDLQLGADIDQKGPLR